MARAIDADRLADGLKLHRQPTDQKHEADRQWAVGYNAGLDRALHSIAYAPTLTQPPVTGDTSDGYHTFNELYHHRAELFVVISALRPITREQLEKVWKGEWIAYFDGEHIMPERYYSCSKCGDRGYTSKRNFCDSCGAPMTDEAVDMVMKRLEALGYGKDD